MKSSWRMATFTSNMPVVSPYSPFLRIRRAEHPHPSALHETNVASLRRLFLRLVPRNQAIWNIPKPYLSFSQTVSTLIAVNSGWYLIVWGRNYIIELFQSFSCWYSSQRLIIDTEHEELTADPSRTPSNDKLCNIKIQIWLLLFIYYGADQQI